MYAEESGKMMAGYAEELDTERAAIQGNGVDRDRLQAEQGQALRAMIYYGFAALCATIRGDYEAPKAPTPPPAPLRGER